MLAWKPFTISALAAHVHLLLGLILAKQMLIMEGLRLTAASMLLLCLFLTGCVNLQTPFM